MPAPSPEKPNPAINGIRNAAENTGPIKPTDCAMTSTSLSRRLPSRSYPDPSVILSISVATQLPLSSADPWREPYAAAVEPVQPVAGRSNHTCTCPVPTEASYSLNSSPGAVHAAPPSAPAMIR